MGCTNVYSSTFVSIEPWKMSSKWNIKKECDCKWPYLSFIVIVIFFFVVPPGRPLIHNERGILVDTTLGPYNEGAKLMLTCSVSGGRKKYEVIQNSFILIFLVARNVVFIFPHTFAYFPHKSRIQKNINWKIYLII